MMDSVPFVYSLLSNNTILQFVDVEEGEDGGGGGVQVKRLVRFRLCPTDTCLSKKGVGCNYRYGDYVIGLETFVSIYYEYIKQVEEESCEQYLQGSCDCSGENQEEDFDANQCEYDCYAEAGMENICMGNRGDERDDYFDAERHMQCAELRWRNNEGKEEGGQGRRTAEEEQGLGLYVGPYCANQGSSIYLGMFTDAACSEFADNSQGKATFKSLTGTALPYSSQNIVTMDCVSCMDDSSNGQEGDGNNANNKNDAVAEMCQQLYNPAGKCEESIPEGMVQNRDSRACNYISGIQKVGQDGVVRNANSGPGAGTTFFIVLLVSIVLGMFMYVYYLRTRLAATEASKRMAFLEDQYREPPKYNLPRIH